MWAGWVPSAMVATPAEPGGRKHRQKTEDVGECRFRGQKWTESRFWAVWSQLSYHNKIPGDAMRMWVQVPGVPAFQHRRWEGTLQTAISRTQTSNWVPTPCVTHQTPAKLSTPPRPPPQPGAHSSPTAMRETNSRLMHEVNWSGTARDARGQRQHLLFSIPPVKSQPSAPSRSVTGLSVFGSGVPRPSLCPWASY